MIRYLVALIALVGSIAAAEPQSYFVSNVAADDVLNIRRDPNPQAEVIGSYPPFRLNVEVLDTTADGTWGRVGLGEGMGWVSMAYLEATPDALDGTIPRPMSCFGTEPFWSLTMSARGDEYHLLGDGALPLTLVAETTAVNGYLATFSQGSDNHRTLIIQTLPCNDGMSDRAFGFRASLFNAVNGQNWVQSGCCTRDSGN